MDLSYGKEAEIFRNQVQGFLQQAWQPKDLRENSLIAYIKEFRLKAIDAGYLYRNIPKIYGGSEQELDVVKAQVIREEFIRAHAPLEIQGASINILIPVLLEWGSEEQKEMFIRKTILGDYLWVQGYSEPGSGSDVASIQTKAELIGDKWVINGQKIWTSQAKEATHIYMLARTEPDQPKHKGISYLLLDFKQPEITISPIKQITGASEFNQVFFDNATTPANWIVGERGNGWLVSRSTLKHERAMIGSTNGLLAQFDKLVELAKTTIRNGKPAIKDSIVRDLLVKIEGFVLSHRYSSYRIFSHTAIGEEIPKVSMMMKLLLTEIGHEMALLAQELIGDAALIEAAPAGTKGRGNEKWLDQIMGSLGNSIAGGTTNIQKNIIGERGLGLPRDMAMKGQ